MVRIVVFHGCKYLVPVWDSEEWRFDCAIPDGEVCSKTIKKRKPSKECFTETYTIAERGDYDAVPEMWEQISGPNG